MKDNINALHICSYYYGSKLYKNLMNQFAEKGLQFSLYGPCDYNYVYDGNENFLIQDKCFGKLDRLFFHYKYNKIYRSMKEKINISDFNILHAHSLFSNGYIAYRIFKEYNMPYVVAVRNTDLNVFFKYFLHLRKLGQKILENASAIIFISNTYKKILLDKYISSSKREEINNKSYVMPNGIDEFFLKNINFKKRNKNNNSLNLVYTGRIDRNKNIITTIKCCKEILNQKYDVKFTVIGKIENKKYKRLIDKNKFINYIGVKNKEEILEQYKTMDMFVMPSKHETFGLTYVEAMSQGLPVIYTINEGFDGFFNPGIVGYPIKCNDYKEMANKIELILNNYDEISNNCAKESVNFNWSDISKKYIKLYEQIVRKNYEEI